MRMSPDRRRSAGAAQLAERVELTTCDPVHSAATVIAGNLYRQFVALGSVAGMRHRFEPSQCASTPVSKRPRLTYRARPIARDLDCHNVEVCLSFEAVTAIWIGPRYEPTV